MGIETEQEQLRVRIKEFVNWEPPETISIITDTTEFMNIYRGNVLRLNDVDYLITGDTYEPRVGLGDQPKFWVKRAIELSNGSDKILKLVFHEEFITHIGPLGIRCYRNPEKEANVLDLVRGDHRFMQGFSVLDDVENMIRVIDFIKGKSLYAYIMELGMPHEEYFFTKVAGILRKVSACFRAIKALHKNNLCHGDIRNDHIIIERDTGVYRWIDFDLTQDYSDFDVWGLGNIINFVIGKGIRTFHELNSSRTYKPHIKNSLSPDDASAFYRYRIMNLKKLFPYIPDKLNNVLLHFTISTERFYSSAEEVITDMEDAITELRLDH